EVVERAPPIERPQHRPTYARVPGRLPEHRRAEERGVGSEDGGDIGDGDGLSLRRAGQAVKDGVESGRRERPRHRQWLQDVGLDRGDIEVAEAAGYVAEDGRVR